MSDNEPTLIHRLMEGYEAAKKPLAYIFIFVAVLLESLPQEMLPEGARSISYTGVLLVLALILLQVLFDIYERVMEGRKEINIIKSNDLYASIHDIASKEKYVNIKYVGVAGRHGWSNVIEKMINENDSESLVQKKIRFDIDIALMDPGELAQRPSGFRRFEALPVIAKDIAEASVHLPEVSSEGSSLRLHFYQHMPNMIGLLVNDNYLFMSYAYWDKTRGEWTLRAGGSDYFVYDKNDDFGGQEVIRRFLGWFCFIVESENRGEVSGVEEANLDLED